LSAFRCLTQEGRGKARSDWPERKATLVSRGTHPRSPAATQRSGQYQRALTARNADNASPLSRQLPYLGSRTFEDQADLSTPDQAVERVADTRGHAPRPDGTVGWRKPVEPSGTGSLLPDLPSEASSRRRRPVFAGVPASPRQGPGGPLRDAQIGGRGLRRDQSSRSCRAAPMGTPLLREGVSARQATHQAPRTTHHAPSTKHQALRTTHYALRTTHPSLLTVHFSLAYLNIITVPPRARTSFTWVAVYAIL
jgi:hypothetical protein